MKTVNHPLRWSKNRTSSKLVWQWPALYLKAQILFMTDAKTIREGGSKIIKSTPWFWAVWQARRRQTVSRSIYFIFIWLHHNLHISFTTGSEWLVNLFPQHSSPPHSRSYPTCPCLTRRMFLCYLRAFRTKRLVTDLPQDLPWKEMERGLRESTEEFDQDQRTTTVDYISSLNPTICLLRL